MLYRPVGQAVAVEASLHYTALHCSTLHYNTLY
jgi:hypothetical protein